MASGLGALGNDHVDPGVDLPLSVRLGPDERGDDIVVVNVWGSWCPPCRTEAEALEEVYQDLQDQGVQFLGINTRDQEKPAQAFVASKGISGKDVGPFKYFGTRPDDPNDIHPHEHRRELRAMRVFGAWLNHDDSRAINTRDFLQEVGSRFDERKTLRHPEVGEIEVHCQALFTEDQSQVLLVLTPMPGTGAAEALGLLGVVGEQRFSRS